MKKVLFLVFTFTFLLSFGEMGSFSIDVGVKSAQAQYPQAPDFYSPEQVRYRYRMRQKIMRMRVAEHYRNIGVRLGRPLPPPPPSGGDPNSPGPSNPGPSQPAAPTQPRFDHPTIIGPGGATIPDLPLLLDDEDLGKCLEEYRRDGFFSEECKDLIVELLEGNDLE